VENKISALDDSCKSKEAVQKYNLFSNSNLLFFLFLFIIHNTKKTLNFPDENSNLSEEEYLVAMEEAPANKPIFQLNNTNEIYSMMENIKPYLSTKNQHAITVLERGRKIAQDMNELLIMAPSGSTQASSIHPDTIVNLLSDIKPYINRDYHNQIEDFSKGIHHIIGLQKNINHLENTLSTIHTIKDDAKKIENIVHSIKPFLSKDKKNTIGQLENISQVMELMKTANILQKDLKEPSDATTEPSKKQSDIMELLDLFDKEPVEKENKVEISPPIKEDQP
jgi:hypothetical protein